MKKILLYCVALLLSFLVFAGNTDAATLNKDRYIVQYDSQKSKSKIEQAVTEVIYELDSLSMLVVAMDEDVLVELQKQGHVKHFEKNQSYKIHSEFKVANLSEADRWNLKELQVNSAWQNGYTGKGVKIGIIDSGIANHSDLAIAGGVSFVGQSYDDDHGHGTHVAGIVGAKHNGVGVAGIAPNAEIYAIKSIKSDGFGDVVDVLKGIDWAIENQMDIINLSFGDLEYSDALYEGVVKATNRGILIVAASGNEGNASGTGNTLNYPARYEEVISVAAVNRQLNRAEFSGTGPTNDFAAPGVDIYSTYLNGQYATYNGTSMAAPHIAGVLALLKEQYPYLSAKQLYEGLQLLAKDLGTPGADDLYGYGLPKYQLADEQKIVETLNENPTAAQLKKQVETMPKSLEKLALLNKWAELEQQTIKQLDELLASFGKTPTDQLYIQVTKQLEQLGATDLQETKKQQLEAIIAEVITPAEKAIRTFERNKTVHNYNKAMAELNKLPSLPQKITLSEQLEAQLQQFAQTAKENLATYEKNPTKDNYTNAKFSINNLPASKIKEQLTDELNALVQVKVKQATSAIITYEKQQTLKNYQAAMKIVQTVYEEQPHVALEKRVKKTVANNLTKAKARVKNYEKKKTKSNKDLAMKVLLELPNSKEKTSLLQRLTK